MDNNVSTEKIISQISDHLGILYTRRYMWRLKSSDNVYFKILTDTFDTLKKFEQSIIKEYGDDLLSFGYEYVCEYRVSAIGIFNSVYVISQSENETPVSQSNVEVK